MSSSERGPALQLVGGSFCKSCDDDATSAMVSDGSLWSTRLRGPSVCPGLQWVIPYSHFHVQSPDRQPTDNVYPDLRDTTLSTRAKNYVRFVSAVSVRFARSRRGRNLALVPTCGPVQHRNSFRSCFAHRARTATRDQSSPRRERTKSSLIILFDAICVPCLSRRASYCRSVPLRGSGWKRLKIGAREVVCFLE
jgi:hypothetical protein